MKRRSSKPQLPHAVAMQRHACRAMWERHGLVMTATEYLDLCVLIFMGGIPPVMRDDRGALVYPLTHRGVALYAVWSHAEARIVTLLPCKAWVGNRKRGKRFVRGRVTYMGARA